MFPRVLSHSRFFCFSISFCLESERQMTNGDFGFVAPQKKKKGWNPCFSGELKKKKNQSEEDTAFFPQIILRPWCIIQHISIFSSIQTLPIWSSFFESQHSQRHHTLSTMTIPVLFKGHWISPGIPTFELVTAWMLKMKKHLREMFHSILVNRT